MIKNHYYFSLLLILFASFSSCQKIKDELKGKKKQGNHITVDVFVIDESTSLPIRNAKVVVLESYSLSISGQAIAAHYADSKGKVQLDFEGRPGYHYSVVAEKNLYFNNVGAAKIIDSGDKKAKTTIRLRPKGFVKLHVKNVQPFDESDLIYFNSYCLSFDGVFNKKNLDTIIWYPGFDCEGAAYGNYNLHFAYWITKNQITTRKEILAFIPAFDTTLININY